MSTPREVASFRSGAGGDRGRLLRIAMKENALVAGLTGSTLVVGPSVLNGLLGVNPWVLGGIGVGLLIYAVFLIWWAHSPRWLRTGGWIAVIGDASWVVAAVMLVALTDVLTRTAIAALAMLTLVVAGFAVVQYVGLRRLYGTER